MSTHELDLALQAADKIWLMSMENKTYSGAPEDLVLNDVFGQAFIREGIEFDKSHGVFKVVEPHCEEIEVQGDETGTFWTKRAVERLGYSATNQKNKKRNIQIDNREGKWVWRYFHNDKLEVLFFIEELIAELKPKGGHI